MDLFRNACGMPNKLEDSNTTKLNADQTKTPTESGIEEPFLYDYMKYPKKKKGKGQHGKKIQKSVSFKQIVEHVTFTEDWKMQISQSNLRSDDEKRKCTNLQRNY